MQADRGDRADLLPVEEGVRRSEDGPGQASQVALEKENARLKKLVAALSVDNQILQEDSSGNFLARRRGEEP